MPQYSTNAIYEFLKVQTELNNNYLYIQDGNWMLIYGDANAVPKLLLIVSRIEGDLLQPRSAFEEHAVRLLAGQQIPIRILRFEEKQFSEQVSISSVDNLTFKIMPTDKLYAELFQPYNLTADSSIATKQVNDATSSTFHDWQRSFLSGKLKVTDIDVIVYNNDYVILRIYELKRSFYALAKWNPYPADYANFILLRRAFKENIPILILYNMFTGKPRVEDISLLRVFKVSDDKPTIQNIHYELDGNQIFDFPIARLFN